jgi:hypothetical protein
VDDAAAGIKIRADYHDSEDDGFAAGLSNCIARDGQSTVSQNIPFNSKRITGLGDPLNDQDAATKKWAATQFDAKLDVGGDTMTGNLLMDSANPTLTFDSDVGGTNTIYGKEDGKNRWTMSIGDATAEVPITGTNVGSNFRINSYKDDGSALDLVLSVVRSTGLASVKGEPTADLGIANKKYVDDKDALSVLKTGGATGGVMTGKLTTANGVGIATVGSSGTIDVRSLTTNAAMFFTHAGFNANFGLAGDGNFYMGGGAHGAANLYKFWTTRDFASAPNDVDDGRLTFAGDVSTNTGTSGSMIEPYTGAVATGWAWSVFDNSISLTKIRMRYLQLHSTDWFTVGYNP